MEAFADAYPGWNHQAWRAGSGASGGYVTAFRRLGEGSSPAL